MTFHVNNELWTFTLKISQNVFFWCLCSVCFVSQTAERISSRRLIARAVNSVKQWLCPFIVSKKMFSREAWSLGVSLSTLRVRNSSLTRRRLVHINSCDPPPLPGSIFYRMRDAYEISSFALLPQNLWISVRIEPRSHTLSKNKSTPRLALLRLT